MCNVSVRHLFGEEQLSRLTPFPRSAMYVWIHLPWCWLPELNRFQMSFPKNKEISCCQKTLCVWCEYWFVDFLALTLSFSVLSWQVFMCKGKWLFLSGLRPFGLHLHFTPFNSHYYIFYLYGLPINLTYLHHRTMQFGDANNSNSNFKLKQKKCQKQPCHPLI